MTVVWKILNVMGTVSRRIVVMEHKGVLCPLFRPLSPDLLSQSSQDFKIVMLVHCLTRWSKFIVDDSDVIKENSQHCFHIGVSGSFELFWAVGMLATSIVSIVGDFFVSGS